MVKEQYSHKQILPQYDSEKAFRELFQKAKEKDEFEFCCALLRIRGIEGPGWDTLFESMNLLNQNLAVIHSPIDQSYRMRLMLMTYCHATEMFDFYSVVGNMLRICVGDRCSMDCFIGANHSSGKDARYPLPKALRIKEWAEAAGLSGVGDLILDMLVKEVRNAFFHSSYILTNESLNIKRGDGVRIVNVISPKVEYQWLLPRIELGINTVLSLISLMDESRLGYEENKIVMGRIQGDQPVPVELMIQPGHGLVGFRSPPTENN